MPTLANWFVVLVSFHSNPFILKLYKNTIILSQLSIATVLPVISSDGIKQPTWSRLKKEVVRCLQSVLVLLYLLLMRMLVRWCGLLVHFNCGVLISTFLNQVSTLWTIIIRSASIWLLLINDERLFFLELNASVLNDFDPWLSLVLKATRKKRLKPMPPLLLVLTFSLFRTLSLLAPTWFSPATSSSMEHISMKIALVWPVVFFLWSIVNPVIFTLWTHPNHQSRFVTHSWSFPITASPSS